MRSVHVTRTIPAPAEEIFDRLADHNLADLLRALGVRVDWAPDGTVLVGVVVIVCVPVTTG